MLKRVVVKFSLIYKRLGFLVNLGVLARVFYFLLGNSSLHSVKKVFNVDICIFFVGFITWILWNYLFLNCHRLCCNHDGRHFLGNAVRLLWLAFKAFNSLFSELLVWSQVGPFAFGLWRTFVNCALVRLSVLFMYRLCCLNIKHASTIARAKFLLWLLRLVVLYYRWQFCHSLFVLINLVCLFTHIVFFLYFLLLF